MTAEGKVTCAELAPGVRVMVRLRGGSDTPRFTPSLTKVVDATVLQVISATPIGGGKRQVAGVLPDGRRVASAVYGRSTFWLAR